MTFLELAKEVLRYCGYPMGYKEIWEKACELGLDKKLGSNGKTPHDTLSAQLYINIRDRGDNSDFILASRKPTTFWLRNEKENKSNVNLEIHKTNKEKEGFNERDLHPLLVSYLAASQAFRGLKCKTIYHEKNKKQEKGKDKWENPDIVGAYIPFNDYGQEVLDMLKHINSYTCRLYSFELKIELNFSNLKESYFQAVSNSSWANEGYLVVFREIDNEVLNELTRLNASFGIGVIWLKPEVLDSKILLPAKERNIDLDKMNLLSERNKDFCTFLSDLNKQITAGAKTQIVACFDRVLDTESGELEKYIRDKKILHN